MASDEEIVSTDHLPAPLQICTDIGGMLARIAVKINHLKSSAKIVHQLPLIIGPIGKFRTEI